MAASTQSPTKLYLMIWAWLAGLMLIGVFLSERPIPKATIVLIVLGLSSSKATLDALYYMHLKMDRRVLALVALVPLVLIVLALGVVLSSRLVQL